jgi:serine/threonine protein kinase
MNNRDLKNFMKKFHSKYGDENISEVLVGFFLLQIIKGMEHLKMQNIVHRDIKPENIMLNSNYLAKIGDFSLSRKINHSAKFKTSRSGTMPYLSPECVIKKIHIKSTECEKIDIFALGVLMYSLLFNRHPYNYKNNMSISEYSKILQKSELKFEGNEISSCCKDFVNKLLEKNIKKRVSFDMLMNHKWVKLIRTKVDDIVSKYQSDPEKMINELQNCKLKDEYFQTGKYFDIDIDNEISMMMNHNSSSTNVSSHADCDVKLMNKKRRRNKQDQIIKMEDIPNSIEKKRSICEVCV